MQKVDTYRSVETPEGVELGLRTAGPLVRGMAWAIDTAIWFVLMIGIQIMMGIAAAITSSNIGTGPALLLAFAAFWMYPVLFEVLWQGATPGKMICGVRVLHDDGTPVGWTASALRNVLRVADFLPAMYGLGLAAMVLDRDFRRVGDLAAGTVVVYADLSAKSQKIPSEDPVAPPIPLDLPEQRAIVAFAERVETWSRARRDELADVVTPLTKQEGSAGAQKLVGMANWLIGRR